MRYHLGLSSYAYYWAAALKPNGKPFTAWDLLDRTVALGLDVVQICENVPLVGWAESDLERFRESATRQGVLLELGVRSLDFAHLRTAFETAHILGSRILRFVPWSGSQGQQRLPGDKLYGFVKALLPLCREYAITLAIENYFDIRDEELVACVERLGDEHIGICLDTANSTGFLQPPLETVKVLAPYTVSLHLKDFIVLKPAIGYRVTGVALGQGWLDVPAVLNIIREAGRQPHVLLELWVDEAESEAATLSREDDWVRESVAYARDQLNIAFAQP